MSVRLEAVGYKDKKGGGIMAKQYDDITNRNSNSNNNIKRTGEHVLTWIGVAIQALVAIMFLMIKPFIGNADFKEQIINETQKQGNEVSITEINNGMDALGGLFNFFTWGAVHPINSCNYWRYFN